MFRWAFSTLLGWFTGGTLDRILDTVEHRVDNETRREEIKAEITQEYLRAQSQLLVNRTWWFQLFFVIPLGAWFTAVILDSIFLFSWNVAALPAPLDEWGGWIVMSLFLIDGAKTVIGRARG